METIHAWIGVLAACVLAGCGSVQDANERNFKKAIDSYYAHECILVQPEGGMGVSHEGYPVTVRLEDASEGRKAQRKAELNRERTIQFEALARVGLLTAEDTVVETKAHFFGNRLEKRPGRRYSLTEEGARHYRSEPGSALIRGRHGFCAGHYAVDEIRRFTEPGTVGGYTISQVVYTYSPRDVQKWAQDPAVRHAIPSLDEALRNSREGKATLVLTNEGWVHERDFER